MSSPAADRPTPDADPSPRSGRGMAGGLGAFAGWVCMGLGLAVPQASLAADASDTVAIASPAASEVTAWVLETGDNQGLPFVIIDKVNAQALAFDRDGRLLGAAPVLLGLAEGDVSPPGIGNRPLSAIGPEDRITPSGRFQASLGENLDGTNILWVDYEAALSLHPVVTARASDRRLQRLDSASALDNRISYGCINVPATFYEEVVRPAFNATVGIVYILPETRSFEDVFVTPPAVGSNVE